MPQVGGVAEVGEFHISLSSRRSDSASPRRPKSNPGRRSGNVRGGCQTRGMAAERHPSDGYLILAFADSAAFEEWLDARHAAEPGVWVKFAKKGRGIASVTLPDATEVALCFGWI